MAPHRLLVHTATAALLLPLLAAWSPRPRPHGDRDDSSRFPVVDKARHEKSWQVPAGAVEVVVDGIAGSIRARAVAGDTVTVEVEETVRGRDAASVALARREMPLLLEQRGALVNIFVDSPFRRPNGGFHGDWDDVPYRVEHNFEVTLPPRARVVLKTINGGDVELVGTEGGFEVRNVNGSIELRDVAGAGSARTVNGDVSLSFRRNPEGPCEVASVNGDVTLELLPGLAADVRYKTLNGEGWSDFAFDLAPRATAPAADRRDGRYVLRDRWQNGIRIGGGGPLLSLETLNGDVYLRNRRATGAS
jgi:hypothetical protein